MAPPTPPDLYLTDTIPPEAEALVGNALNTFNDETTGYTDRLPLAVLLRDPATGAILGGAIGRTSLGLMFLDLFHLPAHLRGAGLGSRVLQMFEAEAHRRGCRNGVLFTISFQAPLFYERHGWRRFGEIPCDPPGTSRIYLTKTLAPPPPT